MKRAGTMKVELIAPLDLEWRDVGPRLRALTRTLPLALNLALRDVFVRAMNQVEQVVRGEHGDTSWQNDVRKRLRYHWGEQLTRHAEWAAKQVKREGGWMPPSEASAAPGDVLCSETSAYITSRFSGEHFRALLAGRAGLPDFTCKAFYSEGRYCVLSGSSDEAELSKNELFATLSFPLWATGKGATRFAVAPCGGSHRALWDRFVRATQERENVLELMARAKKPIPKDASPAERKAAEAERQAAAHELECSGTIKVGRIGISYDERKRKWYALISWTEFVSEPTGEGQAVACNFGINCLIAAMTESGEVYEDAGTDILAMRTRFQQRRRSLQKHSFHRGKGSRGHGVKRREKSVTELGDVERRWVQNRIRRAAVDFASWCKRHNVGVVYLEDLSGVREAFERSTRGDAHEELKRWIHNWPFYETQSVIARQLEEVGILVKCEPARFASQRCPACGHTAPENVKLIGGDWQPVPSNTLLVLAGKDGEYRVTGGVLFRRERKRSWFECVECKTRGDGDTIACANHLLDVGKTHALSSMQGAARKRVNIERRRSSKAKPEAAE
jgi:IS605 OrfB family transposase